MQNIKMISIEESDIWDDTVRSFKNHDIYYFSGYVKAFMLHGDGKPHLIYYNNGRLKGINVVMLRALWECNELCGVLKPRECYDIATPYGYGGFLLEGNTSDEEIRLLDNEYVRLCREKKIVSEFVRFHPVLENQKKLDQMYEIMDKGKTIGLALDSESLIWDNIESKKRNRIRKARTNGIQVYWGLSEKLMGYFIEMYNKTMDKDNADPYYYFKKEFYDSILNDCRYNSLMFYSVYQDKIVAMSIVLFVNKKMHCHLMTSLREYQDLEPVSLMVHEMAVWGCKNGMKTLHMGGGLGGGEDSLYRFKSSFNRNSNYTFYIGKKIFDQECYQRCMDIRTCNGQRELKTSFFPEYRG